MEVICYPSDDGGVDIEEVLRDEEGNAEIPQDANNTVVVFDESTNGEPIEGDLNLQAENITIFGNGVDRTIIDGNVTLASNNARIRGVTITGDLTVAINSNNNKVSFCKIYGDVEVRANEFTMTNCQVFGDFNVNGNGAKLVNVGVQGQWTVNPTAYCEGCYSFVDENEDFIVQDTEIGDALTCGPGE